MWPFDCVKTYITWLWKPCKTKNEHEVNEAGSSDSVWSYAFTLLPTLSRATISSHQHACWVEPLIRLVIVYFWQWGWIQLLGETIAHNNSVWYTRCNMSRHPFRIQVACRIFLKYQFPNQLIGMTQAVFAVCPLLCSSQAGWLCKLLSNRSLSVSHSPLCACLFAQYITESSTKEPGYLKELYVTKSYTVCHHNTCKQTGHW